MENGKANELPQKLTEALERSKILVGEDQLEYFYNLYDPETGGFYYSISSRDSEEMTPFAEGTYFTISALQSGGITLPDWYKEKVSEWILSHQDPDDGFFYEKLWGKLTSINPGPRINRDLNYSTNILRICGKEPRYMLPQDRIKEGVGNATLPAYLESREAMLAYLDGLDWSTKSIWSTGQRLSTAGGLIKAAGYTDLVREYIESRQNPDTGLWGEGLEWMNTNGAMKLSCYFANVDHPFPNPEKAIDSVLKIYSGEIPPMAATYIWNPFVLLSRIIGYAGERDTALRELLYDKGADIVNRAVDCALLLKRADGGFAGNIRRGGHRQQGFLYGHGFENESDLDGTLIAGERLYNSMHSVFGIPPSKDYYAHLGEEFFERCRTKAPIVKTLPRPEGDLTPPKK